MGVAGRFTLENEDYSTIWTKHFMAYHDQISPLSTDRAYYGVSFGTDEEDAMDYLAGMAVGRVTSVPQGLVVREVPAGRYAVFEWTVKTISEMYDHVFGNWLPASQYGYGDPLPSFEYYPPDTETVDSPVFLYVPVRRKGERNEAA